MSHGSNTGLVPVAVRPASWKRRLRIVDLVALIGILAVDLALLRAWSSETFVALVPLLGLLAILVGFVWRYVPRRWDRPCYVAALLLYVVFLGMFVAARNPFLAGPLMRAMGLQ